MSPKLFLLGLAIMAFVSVQETSAGGLVESAANGISQVIGGLTGGLLPHSVIDYGCQGAMAAAHLRRKRFFDPLKAVARGAFGGLAGLGRAVLGDQSVREGCRQAGASDVHYLGEPEPEKEVQVVQGPTQYVPVPTPVVYQPPQAVYVPAQYGQVMYTPTPY